MKYPEAKIIGERVKKARILANLSLSELSKKTGIGYSTLSRIEKGTRIINVAELIRVSEKTGKSITYFFQEGNELIEFYYPPSYRH